jgi:hypothetical protein
MVGVALEKTPIHIEKPKSHESTFNINGPFCKPLSTQPSNPSWHFVEFLTLYSTILLKSIYLFIYFFLSFKAWFAIVPMSFAPL